MLLYGYWRSSAAYRVRIALNLKNIAYESKTIHLVKNGGEQHLREYEELNPSHLVPTLVDGDLSLNQSIAIIDYLEAKHPETKLYPADVAEKALVQAMALDIACEVHPLNNLRVQQYLTNELNIGDSDKLQWVHYWMKLGFSAFEQQLVKYAGEYCFGNSMTLADICLVPQVYNAKRFNLDMSPYPKLMEIVNRCNQHQAFIDALPENQPDAI